MNRSTRDGAWFLTRRGAEAMRDPRLRRREEDEHRARLANQQRPTVIQPNHGEGRRPDREEGRREARPAGQQRMWVNGYVDEALNQIVEGLANNRRLLEDRQDQQFERRRREEGEVRTK